MDHKKRDKTFYWIAIAAALAGIVNHIYLLSKHYALEFGQASASSLCNINDLFNCDAVSASKFAVFLGVPIAVWGAAANTVLLLLLLWRPFTDDQRRPAHARNLLAVSIGIATASIVMGAISTIALGKICPFCVVAYALSFVACGAIWLLKEPVRAKSALQKTAINFGDYSPMLILTAIAFVGSFIVDDAIRKSYGARDLTPYVQDAISAWTSGSKTDFSAVEPLVKGVAQAQAKVLVTEFADFRCIHCKHAAPVLKAFVNANSDVRLEFMPWPLDGECNTSIAKTNKASCLLARTVYCAQKISSRGWEVHDYVYERLEDFMNVEAVQQALPDIAKVARAEAQPFAACADSEETKEVVRKQAALGTTLNINGTPAIFVNGKKLPNGQILRVLQEVRAAVLTGK